MKSNRSLFAGVEVIGTMVNFPEKQRKTPESASLSSYFLPANRTNACSTVYAVALATLKNATASASTRVRLIGGRLCQIRLP